MARIAEYRVKKKDNLLSLSKKYNTTPAKILKNNSIKRLRPGQTIRISSNPNIVKQDTQPVRNSSVIESIVDSLIRSDLRGRAGAAKSPQNMNQFISSQLTPLVEPFMNSSGMSGFQPIPLNNNPYSPSIPNRPPGMYNPPRPPTFSSPGSQIRQDEVFLPTGTNKRTTRDIRRNAAGVPPSVPQPDGSPPAPPVGAVYTGHPDDPNTKIFKDLWNYQAKNPPKSPAAFTPEAINAARQQFLSGNGLNPNSGYIPTRYDIWLMKVNARRRRNEKAGSGDFPTTTATPLPPASIGNAVNTALSWNVG